MQTKTTITICLAVIGLASASTGFAQPGDAYPDWGFNGTGRTSISFDLGGDQNDFAADSAVGDDGSLYLAGTVTGTDGHRRIGIAKLDPDGNLDAEFSSDGKNTSTLNDVVATGIALTETRIYVSGYTVDSADSDMVVCQFVRSNGSNIAFPDNGGASCVFPDSLPGTVDVARDILVQPDGRIVIAGTMAGVENQDLAAFARFEADGQRDTTFGNLPGTNLALVRSQNIYEQHRINAIARAGNGKLVAVGSTRVLGSSNTSALVIRLGENGGDATEFSFDRAGSATRDTELRDIAMIDDPASNDDAAIVGGRVELSTDHFSGMLARITSDANAVDETFGESPGGITAITLNNANLAFTDIATETDGSIVTLGLRSPDGLADDLGVRRFLKHGQADTAFGDNGNTLIDFNFPGDFHGAAAIGTVGDAIYLSGWAAQSPNTTDVDFVAVKLVSGSEAADVFADGFED